MHHKKVACNIAVKKNWQGIFGTKKSHNKPSPTQPPPALDPTHKNRQPQHREDKTQLATFPFTKLKEKKYKLVINKKKRGNKEKMGDKTFMNNNVQAKGTPPGQSVESKLRSNENFLKCL